MTSTPDRSNTAGLAASETSAVVKSAAVKSAAVASAQPAKISRPAPLFHYLIFIVLAILGTTWDLISKAAVFNGLGYPGRRSLWTQTFLNDWIQFRYLTSFNEGALWGMGQGLSYLFAILSVCAAGGILIWLIWFRGAASIWLCVTLGLVMAGTLGNLYDRLGWHGYEVAGRKMYAVRDFLSFSFGEYHYPIFNFADVFLVTGAIMLAFYSLFLEGHVTSPEEPQSV